MKTIDCMLYFHRDVRNSRNKTAISSSYVVHFLYLLTTA